jgi:hypothetical protein
MCVNMQFPEFVDCGSTDQSRSDTGKTIFRRKGVLMPARVGAAGVDGRRRIKWAGQRGSRLTHAIFAWRIAFA